MYFLIYTDRAGNEFIEKFINENAMIEFAKRDKVYKIISAYHGIKIK